MKFLIIQQKMIGDVLTSTILCEALKIKFPNCETHYLVNHNTVAVVENNPYVDKLIIVDKQTANSTLKLLKFAKSNSSIRYNALIDVYGSLGSMLISMVNKSKLKIAYSKAYNGLFYNKTISRSKKSRHNYSLAIENRMRLLEPLGIDFIKLKPKIFLLDDEIKTSKQFLIKNGIDLDKKLIMISVLGSNPDKTYPFEYMAELLDEIVSFTKEVQILFNYIPNQFEDAKTIYLKCKPKTQKSIYLDVFAKDLRTFLAVTHHCDALIGNEGGANNMAKALNIPTFTIFAPSLGKGNWFGKNEADNHMAVHLSDYISFSEDDKLKARKNPQYYYRKLKPDLIKLRLQTFLKKL